jgi:dienelactone hydrolase
MNLLSLKYRVTSFSALAGVAGLLFIVAPAAPQQPDKKPPEKLPLFLDAFKGHGDPAITARETRFPSATRPVHGYVARQATNERLPAILLLSDREGLTEWIKLSARELASIGYVVLAVDPVASELRPLGSSLDPARIIADEKRLASLSAAVRWLRQRTDVLPDQVGVVGIGWGASEALALSATCPMQACVLCDGVISVDPVLLAGLRSTPLLGLYPASGAKGNTSLDAFDKVLTGAKTPHTIHLFPKARSGFLGPPESKAFQPEASDRAWVEMYEFLGKYVEDAPLHQFVLQPLPGTEAEYRPLATIADIMHAINEPTGVRGKLLKQLDQPPAGAGPWKAVRAQAAVVAEAGRLLQKLDPPRGPHRSWKEQTQAYTATAEALLAAAQRRDYPAAQRNLEVLGKRCAGCHQIHR